MKLRLDIVDTQVFRGLFSTKNLIGRFSISIWIVVMDYAALDTLF